MAIEIFLSYTWSKEKINEIEVFSSDLEKRLRKTMKDISIFYDKANITASGKEDYFKPILKSHLNNSKVMLILLSPDWLRSKWCYWEFKTFNNLNRPFIPILWSKIDDEKVSSHILRKVITTNHINYINKNEYAYEALIKRIFECV